MPLDNVIDDGQSQTGSFRRRFGREECFLGFLPNFFGHADAIVANLDAEKGAAQTVAFHQVDLDIDNFLIGRSGFGPQRIVGIVNQVDDGPLQALWLQQQQRQVILGLEPQRDPPLCAAWCQSEKERPRAFADIDQFLIDATVL